MAGLVAGLCLVTIPARSLSAQAMPGMGMNTSTMDLDRKIRLFALADVLEYVPNGTGSLRIDVLSWMGGDYNRVYFRVDGNQPFRGNDGEIAFDAAIGHLVSPFWTALIGGRVETRGLGTSSSKTRALLGVGFEGMSPYFFEIEPTLYVSTKGDVSAHFVITTDVLFSQRLIVQPRFETHLALQAVPEFGLGAGINDVELGARMRYEYTRKFAPYVGLSYTRSVGATTVLARAAGERVKTSAVVFGARVWR